MHTITLAHPVDFDGWRAAARTLRLAGVPPPDVSWRLEGDAPGPELFAQPLPQPPPDATFNAPRAFVDLAQAVICHADPARFALLYRLLWRLREEPDLLHLVTDDDMIRVLNMQKAVAEAVHKMHAFVRFRRVDEAPADAGAGVAEGEEYAAWYEPPHYVIARGVGFFVKRLANVRFSIVSPYVTVAWDKAALHYGPGGDAGQVPAEDDREEDWKAYFAHVFNPARLNPKVMTQHMAKRYWRNLPEAELIPGMIAQAQARTETMVAAPPTAPSPRAARSAARAASPGLEAETPVASLEVATLEVASLEDVAAGLQSCRRCDLWRDATQGVPGDGPGTARLVFVGEQPGDMEDLRGKPFVGPAGQLFDRALAQAGVPRAQTYVTNAVKHFKHELRGKRRIHQKPEAGEVKACRWWLSQELALIKPQVIVALGATAATSVFGKTLSVQKNRGPVGDVDGVMGVLTVHPSFLLRLPDEEARLREFELFVRDLAQAYALLGAD